MHPCTALAMNTQAGCLSSLPSTMDTFLSAAAINPNRERGFVSRSVDWNRFQPMYIATLEMDLLRHDGGGGE